MFFVLGMVLTTTFSMTPAATNERTLMVSREASVFMVIGYIMYLIFQLFTHKALFESEMDVEVGYLRAWREGRGSVCVDFDQRLGCPV